MTEEENFDVKEALWREFGSEKKYPPEQLTKSNKDEEEESNRPTQAEQLLKIASSLILFHDQDEEAYVLFGNESISLRSRKVKHWLSHQFYKATEGKAPNSDSLNQAINVLEGIARYDNSKKNLSNRIAKKDDAFWYDVGKGKAIKVTSEGWGVVDAPILFRRYQHQQPQEIPIKGGNPWEVFNFLNVSEEHHLLVLVYMISCFIPDIPHPIFHPHGAQGSGKTTLCRVIKKLCDPSILETPRTPRDLNELVQVIAHHHICLFDNLSDLRPWMSDILAQACTGLGFSKRQLYTDDEDVIYQVKRCIGLNGINLLISKPDLMDRAILLHLERIEPSKMIEESKLWDDFEKVKPEILGGIFDVLVRAMAIYTQVNLKPLPRMADFYKWGCAITVALDRDGNEFMKAYQGNIVKQNEEVIENNTLAQAVISMMSDKENRSGTMKEIWEELKETAGEPDKADHTFPRSERSLRKDLERIKTNLMDIGITYRIGKHAKDDVPIYFQKVRNFTSLSSFTSHANKINDLKGEDVVKISEDDEDNVDFTSPLNSLKNNENEDGEEDEDKTGDFWKEGF